MFGLKLRMFLEQSANGEVLGEALGIHFIHLDTVQEKPANVPWVRAHEADVAHRYTIFDGVLFPAYVMVIYLAVVEASITMAASDIRTSKSLRRRRGR
jgi:hypothetical protein